MDIKNLTYYQIVLIQTCYQPLGPHILLFNWYRVSFLGLNRPEP